MTRATLVVCPLVALLAVLVAGGAGPVRTGAAVVIGVVAGVGVRSVGVSRVRRVAREVNLLAGDGPHDPLELDGGPEWRALATAVNAFGTQLRSVREELRSLVPWTERLVATLEEPAFVFDPDGRLAAANDGAVVRFGLPRVGDAPTALSALGSAAATGAVEEAVASGRIVTVDDVRGEVTLRVTASPLDDHVLVVVSDQTRERQVEELRRDFVTNASHELKTPVAAIGALVEALRVAAEDRRPQLLARLDEEGARLSRLVRDLLDLRQLDDRDHVERTPVDLVGLVRDVLAEQHPSASRRAVGLAAELPEAAVVAGVAHELRLVVGNLVANAIQYNDEGGSVTVGLDRDGGVQVLTVVDTGVGIPRTAIPRVFERFYRVDVARSRATGGTGLGLSIVRNAVDRHGGTVTVDSLLGAGTTVTVRLPIEAATR